jgi:tetratricopeptide (TPR) repeat protein
MYERALKLRRQVHGDEDLDVATSLSSLADLRQRQRQYVEAEALFREALAIRRKLLDRTHPDLARSVHRLASVLNYNDGAKAAEVEQLYAESEQLTRELLAMRRAVSNPEPREIRGLLTRLGGLLLKQGNYVEAETVLKEAVASWRQMPEAEKKPLGGLLFDLSAVLFRLNKLDEAEAVSREVVAIRRRVFGDHHRETAGALASLANVVHAQGKLPEAEELRREIVAIHDQAAPGSWESLSSRISLGRILLAQKKYEEAETLLRASYEGILPRREQSPTSYPATMKHMLQLLAQLYEETGKPAQAAEWRQKLAEFDPHSGGSQPVAPNP